MSAVLSCETEFQHSFSHVSFWTCRQEQVSGHVVMSVQDSFLMRLTLVESQVRLKVFRNNGVGVKASIYL